MGSKFPPDLRTALNALVTIPDWKDADECAEICRQRIKELEAQEEARKKYTIYTQAKNLMSGNLQDLSNAVIKFNSIYFCYVI